jgi:hypothetical protein
MNVRAVKPTDLHRIAIRRQIVWFVSCLFFWALGIILCEIVIEQLYFRG